MLVYEVKQGYFEIAQLAFKVLSRFLPSGSSQKHIRAFQRGTICSPMSMSCKVTEYQIINLSRHLFIVHMNAAFYSYIRPVFNTRSGWTLRAFAALWLIRMQSIGAESSRPLTQGHGMILNAYYSFSKYPYFASQMPKNRVF